MPDLLILDFAIFAGKRPTLAYLVSLEKLLRFLHQKDTAVSAGVDPVTCLHEACLPCCTTLMMPRV